MSCTNGIKDGSVSFFEIVIYLFVCLLVCYFFTISNNNFKHVCQCENDDCRRLQLIVCKKEVRLLNASLVAPSEREQIQTFMRENFVTIQKMYVLFFSGRWDVGYEQGSVHKLSEYFENIFTYTFFFEIESIVEEVVVEIAHSRATMLAR